MAATDALVRRVRAVLALALACIAPAALAGVLPEDRADLLFHSYSGDGVTIQGPSLLVRKQFAQQFSASANYYVDRVSSASIDVVTTASPYTEKRTQYSLGLDYLHDRWLMSVGLSTSEESDFTADTFSFNISQDVFGDLTTVSLGYTLGEDQVGRRGDPEFSADNRRQHYRLGINQILTRSLVLGVAFETITDEGFLNNPYRSVRFADTESAVGYSYEPEVYPGTRTSDAGSIRLRYFLPYRAALHFQYRRYSDTWGIGADNFEIGYTHPFESGWLLETKVRAYTQDSAEFYSDLFPYSQSQNFLARDKELSTFDSRTLHVGLSYDIVRGGWGIFERGGVNLAYDRMQFDYRDFRDLRVTGLPPGQEPLFNFGADVVQLFVSFWF